MWGLINAGVTDMSQSTTCFIRASTFRRDRHLNDTGVWCVTLHGPLGLNFPICYMKGLGLDAPLILYLTHVKVLIKNKKMSSVTKVGAGAGGRKRQ